MTRARRLETGAGAGAAKEYKIEPANTITVPIHCLGTNAPRLNNRIDSSSDASLRAVTAMVHVIALESVVIL